MSIYLGVNIDHVATLRQARGTNYPDPVEAALIAEQAGADGITAHLREDRRHIQDHDVIRLQEVLTTRLNLEMSICEEMVSIAEKIKPPHVCLVPEKREELTTEGGLDVCGQHQAIADICARLSKLDVDVSLFIDPNPEQIKAAVAVGAPTIEIHTGEYADAKTIDGKAKELQRITAACDLAANLGLVVNAGHGLTIENVQEVAQIPQINELNIGHSIIARALNITEFTTANKVITAVIDKMRISISKGESISNALKAGKIFPPIVTQMVAAGEESGTLDDMLAKSAGFLDEDIDEAIKSLVVKLEPILTFALAGIIGFIALAIYLPMFDIIRQISR